MKIVLINPIVRKNKRPLFPVGLGYIASSLLKDGHEVRVIDANAHEYSDKEIMRELGRKGFDMVGISGMVTIYGHVKRLISRIKDAYPDKKVIVGGPIATPIPRLFLNKTRSDAVVLGEGEETMREIAKNLESNKSLRGVKGCWYKSGSRIIANPPRERIGDLDSLPFPAWELFPMDIYLKRPVFWSESFSGNMNIITTRGCPYHCTFCYTSVGKTVKYRSIKNVMEEIKILVDRYGVKFISVLDENFLLKRDRIMDFCAKLSKSYPDMKWGCAGRVNLVDRELLKKMKDSGCVTISYGIESANQDVLDKMKKGITVEQARNAMRMSQNVGISADPSFMVGSIGETVESVMDSVNFCRDFNIMPGFFFSTPLPGTELYEKAKEMGKIPKDEESYIEKLGEFSGMLVNLTGFSDEQMVRIKNEAENIVRIHQMKSDMVSYITAPVRNFAIYSRTYGIAAGFRRTMEIAKRELGKRI
ncbi:MAG: hypothetical protein DRO99_02345 [Candidatus Aenigmatarchaeota archaeon]|nr:MAG: hypothetical protein DRO99_02345 [Candidatus Aenigmarchaeota archaeon]